MAISREYRARMKLSQKGRVQGAGNSRPREVCFYTYATCRPQCAELIEIWSETRPDAISLFPASMSRVGCIHMKLEDSDI